jgi:hypothetical protein
VPDLVKPSSMSVARTKPISCRLTAARLDWYPSTHITTIRVSGSAVAG